MNKRELIRLTALSKFDASIFDKNVVTYDASKLVYKQGKYKLFKCLLSDVCKFDCKYCMNPWRGKITLTPEEFSKAFLNLNKMGYADGVFISSAIYSDPELVMEDLIKAAELIRKNFKGYIHLKIMPGATRDQILRASKIANRLSINFEVAKKDRFSEICSVKSVYDIKRRERWIKKYTSKKGSYTTQIVVGLGDTDKEIMEFLGERYSSGVSRVYFSQFRALKDTPFEKMKNESRKRVLNLYRADFLIRKYSVSFKKLAAVAGDRFTNDPKILLAEEFGIKRLIDIPGIGFKTLINKNLQKRIKPQYLPSQKKLSDFYYV